MADKLDTLLAAVRACRVCEPFLPLGCNPVVQAGKTARLLIIGQAPGRKVHETGIPWNDASGNRLRQWLNMDRDTFYDPARVAIIPMGFCYPGKGKSGDLPPRKECAPLWHQRLLAALPDIRLTLLIGSYAQRYYLDVPKTMKMAEVVGRYHDFLPRHFVLPHPSPRNIGWFQNHPWFETEVLPELARRVAAAMAESP